MWAFLDWIICSFYPSDSIVKNLPANAGDAGHVGLIPGSGRTPGEGNGKPLQYFSLENPMDRGAWWATVRRIAKSQTQLKRLSTQHIADLQYHVSLRCTAQWFSYMCVFISFQILFPDRLAVSSLRLNQSLCDLGQIIQLQPPLFQQGNIIQLRIT